MLNKSAVQRRLDEWLAVIAAIIADHPDGISEHQIIVSLREAGLLEGIESPEEPWGGLFACHFLVMHLLYQLRNQYRAEGKCDLEIGPLHIRQLAYQSGQQSLSSPDQLSAYYLDLEHLYSTTEEEINAWLDDFWGRYLANDERREAVNVLGLKEPVSLIEVEQRYRQLAMKHHPDRGGDTVRLAEINHAVDVLRKLLKASA